MSARPEIRDPRITYWAGLERAREEVKSGRKKDAAEIIRNLAVNLRALSAGKALKRWRILEQFADTYELNCDLPPVMPLAQVGGELDEYVKVVAEGVSLVTCCRNRNENLLKALPSWLACPEVSEVVIVDWSSDTPVMEDLCAANVEDGRIEVLRVEKESRWILTYAFNVGFRAAKFDKVLKVDADIVLTRDFFARNSLVPGTFIAGDWRIAEKGQEFINGFFYAYRKDLMAVAGFNEFITTYGWDDDDIYSRLHAANVLRRAVDPKTVYHLPHDDSQRLGSCSPPAENGWDDLYSDTRFRIRANRFIANVMPTWNDKRRMMPFGITEVGPGFLRLVRSGPAPHTVPNHVQSHAAFYAAAELLSWRLGPRVLELEREELDRLLSCKRFASITKFDVELALSGAPRGFRFATRYLFVRLEGKTGLKADAVARTDAAVREYSRRWGLSVVVISDSVTIPGLLEEEPVIGSWGLKFVEGLREIDGYQLLVCMKPAVRGHIVVRVDAGLVERISSWDERKLPMVHVRRPRVFIDAQHGLGNRLRAIASAAAIAKYSDRELVVVWAPDHHCECEMRDLFEYDGALIEESFIGFARAAGMRVYNYMEIEKGADKGAKVDVPLTGDVYLRSAYVLNCDLSTWERENEYLRQLRPTEAVLQLVAAARERSELGVHVRMEGGKGLDHNSYDDPSNWTQEGHEQLHYWRAKSHYSRFISRIDQLLHAREIESLFLAADRAEVYEEFRRTYGDRVDYLKRPVYDRSKEQIQYALADAILLSRCTRLLGSSWSSFTELACRLSTNFDKIEMSGRDF